MTRRCGDCQLCCKLLPVRELSKPANTRCGYQKTGKGCSVYGTLGMPPSCKLWSCRWLVDDQTSDLRRPDRAGYVIDIMPDFVRMRNDLTLEFTNIPVLQVWVDPARPEAWKTDDDFRAYLNFLGASEGMCALIRNGSADATFVAPPSMNSDHTWFIHSSACGEEPHTAADIVEAGFSMKMTVQL